MLNKKSKIFVAGHKGLVGSAITRRLKKEGFENLILKTSKELDLTNQADVNDFFEQERPEYVILAAAKVGGILANSRYPAEFIYRNLMISANIIHACYLYGVKKLINLGSSCIYPRLAPQPIKEEHLLTSAFEKTNEAYALAKVCALKTCEFYNKQYGTNFISLMPTNLFGENDNFNMETAHLLPMIMRRFHLAKLYEENKIELIEKDIRRYKLGGNSDEKIGKAPLEEILKTLGIEKGKVILWGDGSVYRELMSSDELADACLYFLENIDAKDIGGDYFVNITSGTDIQLKNLFEYVKSVVGYEGKIEYDKTKPNGTPRKLMDAEKLKSLGWQPKEDLKTSIRKFYEWYVNSQTRDK